MLLLDIDDVLCLNKPYGGYDVALALSRKDEDADSGARDLWEQLFDANACAYLRRLHDEFAPFYVLSTSWWWILDDDKLREVLVRAGPGFVVDNLHADLATPKGALPGIRWDEINAWLAAHPEFADKWVVLDDHLSGTGLAAGQPEEHMPFIVLCAEGVGLSEREYLQLRTAFQLRSAQHGGSNHDDTE
ncbi:HAD domain-containing protein [Variovorax sp. GT1P44]|uniref:HAD domain-containing protein n=1 Tax=Variovorax sp. GT1P44 TaxID=3443742 RepID=UPI003F44D636